MFKMKFSKPERTRNKIRKTEPYNIIEKVEFLPVHSVKIETTEEITKRTARDHASLRPLFGSFEFKSKTRIILDGLEIQEFVSSDLILQVEIVKK